MKFTFILTVFISIASCGNSEKKINEINISENFPNGNYKIGLINDSNEASSELTIIFNDSLKTVSGYSGCNRFTGSYEINGSNIKIGPLAATRMSCPEEKNAVESKMIEALTNANNFLIDDETITLKKDDTNVITAFQTQNNLMITYQASTRGFFEKIWINQEHINFSNDYNLDVSESSKYPDTLWNELEKMVNELDLDSLSNLEAPSKSSHHDAAAAATLQIELNGKTYKTPIFDHGNPPKSIENIVNKVLSMKKKAEKQ